MNKNVYKAALLLIDSSIEQQKLRNIPDVTGLNEIEHAIREFCLVRVGTARGSGHTTAAIRLCKEKFSKALFLARTPGRTAYAKQPLWDTKFAPVTSIRAFIDNSRGYGGFDAVVVDSRSRITEDEITQIIDGCAQMQITTPPPGHFSLVVL